MHSRILVLGTYTCGKTGRLLAKELGADYASQSVWTEEQYDLIIRYGNSFAGLPPKRKHVMNEARHIMVTANKPSMRFKLLGHGVSAPALYDENTIDKAEYPIIARPANHWKGKHFNLVYNRADAQVFINKGYYLQEVINKDTEFRLFILLDKIIEASIKVPASVNSNEMIRNANGGWLFNQYPVAELPRELKHHARMAAELGNLAFCAIDCCVDVKGIPYIFEINSAPSLIPRKVTKLATRIKEAYNLH